MGIITVSISKLLKIKWVKLCEAVIIWHFHQTEKKFKVLITLIKRLLENRLLHTLVINKPWEGNVSTSQLFNLPHWYICTGERRLVHHAPGFYFELELFMPIKWIKLRAENSWTLCSSSYTTESGNWFTDMKDIKVKTARCKTMLPFGWKETA